MNGLRTFVSCALSAIAVGTPVCGSVLGDDEREIVWLAVSAAAAGAVENWHIDGAPRFVVLDRTTPIQLPESLEESERLRVLHQRILDGESVPVEELDPRPADPDRDLVIAADRVVPKELVRRAAKPPESVAIRRKDLPEQGFELWSEAAIDRAGSDEEAWAALTARTHGTISITRPLLAQDGHAALVGYRRHRWGLGGAVVVCLFGRREGRWVLQWQEYVFIE